MSNLFLTFDTTATEGAGTLITWTFWALIAEWEVFSIQTGKSRERCLQLGIVTSWSLPLFSYRTTLQFPSSWNSPLSWNPYLVAQLNRPALTATLLSALQCTHLLPVHRIRGPHGRGLPWRTEQHQHLAQVLQWGTGIVCDELNLFS